VELNQKQQDILRITNDTESKRRELENACEKFILETGHKEERLKNEKRM
jgi:hypothetical protein